MALVHLIVGLALLEYFWFSLAVGRARGRFGIPAPATAGHPEFERYLRVQMNTLEQLIVFIPSILIFAQYFDPRIAAVLGAVFIVGRWLYFTGYTKAANKRGTGFAVAALPMLVLLVGAIVGAVIALTR